ncbi:MAG: ABC transporter permease subunit [Saprospiraceae bacterium]
MKIIDLVKIEIFKYRDNSLVQLLLLFFTLFMSISILMAKNAEVSPLPGGTNSFFQFPYIWEYQAYAGSWLAYIFLGYLGLYLVTSEFGWKTLRQNIISGYTRKDFFLGKLSLAVLISLFATIVFYISTIILGYMNTEDCRLSDVLSHQNYVFLRFFLMVFAYIIFGMMMGFIFRKSGLALLIYFSYILFIEPFLIWGIHYKFISHGRSMLFYPMNGVEDLTPLPLYKYLATFSPIKDFSILLSYTEASIISLVSVSAFIYISYLFLTKKDI